MTYEQYKAKFALTGWFVISRSMNGPKEISCELRQDRNPIAINVYNDPEGVTAAGTIMIPGFMGLISTGKFGCPWNNGAFTTQLRRLKLINDRVGNLVGE